MLRIAAIRTAMLAAACAALVGCAGTEPIRNVDNQRIPRGWSMEELEHTIIEAGRPRGWIMKAAEPGHIVGIINVRDHQAAVDVFYDTRRYSILYRESNNLDYENGRIHRNYNGWIMNLDRDIQTRLSF